jgi:hypothetical protein
MPKKNGQTGAEDAAPVEETTPKSAANSLEARHVKLRNERRALEAELAVIDGKLRDAINGGDLAVLETLTTRKAELPRLFIAASVAETTARQEVFNAEDAAHLKVLRAAEDERDRIQAAILKRRQEFETEIAAMNAQLQEAEIKVSTATGAIEAMRNLGASGDAGFKKSLSALAGV